MGHISSTTRTLFALSIITVVMAVGYYLFFSKIKETNEDASLLASKIDVTVQEEVQLRDLRDAVENTQSDRSRLDSFFITESDLVDFLGMIEGLGGITGADIDVRSIGEAASSDTTGFSEDIMLSVSSKGTWEEVYHFFTLLESLPYRVQMNQVQFSGSVSRGELSEWVGTFGFVIIKIQ